MKKWWIILLILNLFLVLINGVLADVRINEVMYKSASQCSSDSYCEYIEIFNNGTEPVDLTDWRVCGNSLSIGYINKSGNLLLNSTFILDVDDYALITDGGSGTFVYSNFSVDNNSIALHVDSSTICGGLDNSGDSILLNDSLNNLIENFTYTSSMGANGDNNSLQFCNNPWIETNPTPGFQNNCSLPAQDNTPPIDNTNNTAENNSSSLNLSLGIRWEEEDIINRDEFEITIESYNLKTGKYNVKVWIEFDDNDTIISDRYDEENETWKSGTYYLDNFFEGPGNRSRGILLRIRDDFVDFEGDARIFFKIEGEEIKLEKYIEILEYEEKDNETEAADSQDEDVKNEVLLSTNENLLITGKVIKLGNSDKNETENIKTQNNIIFQSKTELIKKYAILGFALLCIILSALFGFNKLK